MRSRRPNVSPPGPSGDPPYATLIDLLQFRAAHQSDERAFLFLVDGELETPWLTYGELDRRARAVASVLAARGLEGKRALLLYPPGLEMVIAFFACLQAGIQAVPVQFPQGPRKLSKVEAVTTDCRPEILLTQANSAGKLERFLAGSDSLAALDCLVTDDPILVTDDPILVTDDPTEAAAGPLAEIGGGTIAYLQYTSGSTSMPKGVRVSHANLLDNLGHFDFERDFEQDGDSEPHRAFEAEPSSQSARLMVTWLPTFHDMGLIYGVLGPIYGGFPCVMMAPAAFLQQPLRWLRAISTYRGTHSASPNFGLEVCARSVLAEQDPPLDLSSWSIARIGAEPIRPETLERFHQTFEPVGFRRQGLAPGYGLAEATLKVTYVREGAGPNVLTLDAGRLKQGRVEELSPDQISADSRRARVLVSCGAPSGATKVAIVDPATRHGLRDDAIGEIWVAGPSVAAGYFERRRATEESFVAYRSDTGEGPYLRTGDLGFLHGGDLYVSGRSKDLIIVRGENHYPQDLEATAERSHPAIRLGHVVAFPVEAGGEERLALVAELERTQRREDPDTIFAAVQRAIAEEHGVRPHTVALVRPASILKTSSGKVRRRETRARFEAGTISTIARHVESLPGHELPDTDGESFDPGRIAAAVVEEIARRVGVASETLDIHQPATHYGLDSVEAQRLTGALAVRLGRPLPATLLFEHASIAVLAEHLSAGKPEAETAGQAASEIAPVPHREGLSTGPAPLAFAQERLWFMEQLEPGMNVLSVTLALDGPLDVAALRYAMAKIVRRHEGLRTRFVAPEGRPVQIPEKELPMPVAHLDLTVLAASACDEAALDMMRRRLISDRRQRLDLETGPPWKLWVVRHSRHRHLLCFSIHHIVFDGGSWNLFVHELAEHYRNAVTGHRQPAGLPEPGIRWTDFASWQRRRLGDEALALQLASWRRRLAGAPAVTCPPTDRPRPSQRSWRGAHHSFVLPEALAEAVVGLSRRRDVTVFTVLLAVFDLLLARYTEQDDVVVGVNVGLRPPGAESLIGCFVNTLAIRTRLSGDPTVNELLERVKGGLMDGLRHREAPYDKVVEAIQPERVPGRTPLFQVVFDYGDKRLPRQVMETFENLGLRVQILAQDDRVRWDLQLFMTQEGGELSGLWSYAADLFDAATIARMHRHFENLLVSATSRPEIAVSRLEMEGEAEQANRAREKAARQAQSARTFLNVKPKIVEI